MSKMLFLLPPSEGKTLGGDLKSEKLKFPQEKPLQIAVNATEKDLKCKGDRYKQGINLNKNIGNGPFMKAIERYSGVMFNAIDYRGMSDSGKQFFENNFGIISGMYGLVFPLDQIGDYKLPVETKGIKQFWGDKITNFINEQGYDYIVDLLPGSYKKVINFDLLYSKIVEVNFLTEKEGKILKISHGVKKIKGEWIKNICEKGINDINDFGGEISQDGNKLSVNLKY